MGNKKPSKPLLPTGGSGLEKFHIALKKIILIADTTKLSEKTRKTLLILQKTLEKHNF